jgi:NAD(P)-dependent dehydrogenase (short-subunit alcohol dehydrogenase family)
MMNPQAKTALITGGAHRVGKAITLALAQASANVVIVYHTSADAAHETEAEARACGVGVLAVPADVADHAQVRAMVDTAVARFGSIDILVNAASLFRQTPFPMTDVSPWEQVIAVSLHGSFYCANAIAPLMLQQGAGVIVNIADLMALELRPHFAAHNVGKAALIALTRQLAVDLAPTACVNAVAPGLVLPPPNMSPERAAALAADTLLGRWGTPQDVADAVLYLIRAEFVTGEVIVVDGGERFARYK